MGFDKSIPAGDDYSDGWSSDILLLWMKFREKSLPTISLPLGSGWCRDFHTSSAICGLPAGRGAG